MRRGSSYERGGGTAQRQRDAGTGARGLRKSFGATEIIRGVDLAIPTGERHAVIGPNGAGKSTLFNLISGLLVPTPARSG